MTYINLFTCSDTDEQVEKVGTIFNGVQMKKNEKTCSFSLYGSIINTEFAPKMNFHFIMAKVDEKYAISQYTVLGSINAEYSGKGIRYFNDIFKIPLIDFEIPEKGVYKILAYRIDEKIGITSDEAESILKNKSEQVCGMYIFEVT